MIPLRNILIRAIIFLFMYLIFQNGKNRRVVNLHQLQENHAFKQRDDEDSVFASTLEDDLAARGNTFLFASYFKIGHHSSRGRLQGGEL